MEWKQLSRIFEAVSGSFLSWRNEVIHDPCCLIRVGAATAINENWQGQNAFVPSNSEKPPGKNLNADSDTNNLFYVAINASFC